MLRRKSSILPSILIFFSLFSVQRVRAEEGKNKNEKTKGAIKEPILTEGVQNDFNSRYIWRGIPFSKGFVMQPSAWASAYGFNLNFWGNFVLDHEPQQGKFNELDITLGYSQKLGKWTLEPALLVYSYYHIENAPTTVELDIKVSYALSDHFSFFTLQTIDTARHKGAYFGSSGLVVSYNPISRVALISTLALGWGNSRFYKTYLDVSKTTMGLLDWTVSVKVDLLKHFWMRPHADLSTLLNKRLNTAAGKNYYATGGVELGVEF